MSVDASRWTDTGVGTESDISELGAAVRRAAERDQERDELIDKIRSIAGRDVPNTRLILKILGHPEVVADTSRYFSALDPSTMCQTYAAPWNCARESEARFENIEHGWTGALTGVGINEWWCETCKKKALGD